MLETHAYPLRLNGNGHITGFVMAAGTYPRYVCIDIVIFRRGRGTIVRLGRFQASVWRSHCYLDLDSRRGPDSRSWCRWFWGGLHAS